METKNESAGLIRFSQALKLSLFKAEGILFWVYFSIDLSILLQDFCGGNFLVHFWPLGHLWFHFVFFLPRVVFLCGFLGFLTFFFPRLFWFYSRISNPLFVFSPSYLIIFPFNMINERNDWMYNQNSKF